MDRMCKICCTTVLAWVFPNAKASYDAEAEVLGLSGEDGGPRVRKPVASLRSKAEQVASQKAARRSAGTSQGNGRRRRVSSKLELSQNSGQRATLGKETARRLAGTSQGNRGRRRVSSKPELNRNSGRRATLGKEAARR
jgi:hypothetical protein